MVFIRYYVNNKECQTINITKDNHRREGQRKIGEERNIEINNTFIVLQEEEKKSIPEEDPTPIVKTDKNENKITAGMGRGKLRKLL